MRAQERKTTFQLKKKNLNFINLACQLLGIYIAATFYDSIPLHINNFTSERYMNTVLDIIQ